jgi:FAD/FMN-containing dehydrogenase
VANSVVNQDLFWALRGGGGSTFGIVVEATIRSHPDIPVTIARWQINTTNPESDGLWDAYAELHRHFPDFVDKEGMSGYYYIYPNKLNGMFLHMAEHAGKANAERIWEPVIKKLSSFPDLKLDNIKYTEYKNYKE